MYMKLPFDPDENTDAVSILDGRCDFRRWYDELSRNPEVELVREGDVERYRAVPVDTPEARDRMTELMRSRAGPLQYGLMRAVWFFAEIKPVRLDPPASATRP